MRFAIQLVIDEADSPIKTQEIASFDRVDGELSIHDLGLAMTEAKSALAALQVVIANAQVMNYSSSNARMRAISFRSPTTGTATAGASCIRTLR
ncbi:hypothetical protein FY036_00930 [Mesorhizobium microcysteis]|uniref:Uncharacterized protein n=1 Tax=Neoaquamicrobium microcysteis TaxID=2682781 RepID=A0A5D4H9A2_9HYPH|nr:hypothetical protein [Mesorhizobium microcysteis]TYR36419.1 hypothetical protein FY036_00930 [Mesorhizobium microcysteis]